MTHIPGTVAHTLLIALALTMAGMLAVDFWPDEAHAAITYSPTTTAKFCNGLPADFPSLIPFDDPDLVGNPACTDPAPIAADSAYPMTTSFSLPGGHSDSGSPLFTSFSPDTFVAPDAGGTGIADGTKVGGVGMTSTLGLLNGVCTTTLSTEFILYDSTTVAGSVSPLPEGTANRNRPLVTDYEAGTSNGIINGADDSYVDGMAVINGGVDVNLSGAVDGADNGTLRGKAVIAGGVDFNGVGGVTVADDGVIALAGTTAITITDGGVDGAGNDMGNSDSPFVSNSISFYPPWFDPDLDYPGGPNGGLPPVVPRARYSGMTRFPFAIGDWRIMSVFVFDPGALAAFSADPDNRPHPFGRFSRAPGDSLVSFAITDDPTAVKINPSPITDTCSPLQVDTMLLGTVPGGGTRSKTPPTNGTRIIGQWGFSQRNADTDSLENPFDTCPFTTDTDDGHRLPPNDHDGRDHDGDGINDACDAGVGFPSVSGSQTDVDNDGFSNGQDNCPQTPNGGALQKDGELLLTYLTAAPDGGPRGDSIGDACDGAIQTGCVVTPPGTANSNTIDDDGDTVVNDGCLGGPATIGDPESSTKGDNPSGLGSATVVNGDFIENYNFVPKCIGPGPDADLDHYCAAQDIDDTSAATGGFSLNAGSDQDGAGLRGDYFGSNVEKYLGTDPLAACGVNAWPADFDNSMLVDISDVLALKPVFGSSVPPTSPRFDISPGGGIDISDVLALKPVFGASC